MGGHIADLRFKAEAPMRPFSFPRPAAHVPQGMKSGQEIGI